MANDNEPKPQNHAQDLVSPSPLPTRGNLCQQCGTQNAQDAKYCLQCGHLLLCPQCKKQTIQAANFCTNCGNSLTKQQPVLLYDKYGPRAEKIKIILQMIVGCILVVVIIVYVAIYAIVFFRTHTTTPLLPGVTPLTIVGVALAISTAFELAYTLFTDGPDEAVNPVITGVAAGILLLISPNLNAGAVALLAIALVVLFSLRYFFIDRGLEHLLRRN